MLYVYLKMPHDTARRDTSIAHIYTCQLYREPPLRTPSTLWEGGRSDLESTQNHTRYFTLINDHEKNFYYFFNPKTDTERAGQELSIEHNNRVKVYREPPLQTSVHSEYGKNG